MPLASRTDDVRIFHGAGPGDVEREFAAAFGARHALAVNAGFSALVCRTYAPTRSTFSARPPAAGSSDDSTNAISAMPASPAGSFARPNVSLYDPDSVDLHVYPYWQPVLSAVAEAEFTKVAHHHLLA